MDNLFAGKKDTLFGSDFSSAPINLDFSSEETKNLLANTYQSQAEILEKKIVTDEVLNMNFTV